MIAKRNISFVCAWRALLAGLAMLAFTLPSAAQTQNIIIHKADGTRLRYNIADIDSYIHAIGKGVRPAEYELIDRCTHYNDRITTALRTRQGLPLRELSSEERAFLMNAARQALSQGLLTISDDYLRLTRQGLFISDSIMSDLIWINEE